METTVGVSSFRNNISQYLDACEQTPLAIFRHNRVYIMMTKEHYVDLINKIKMPNIMQMPVGVQTIVHFTTITNKTS